MLYDLEDIYGDLMSMYQPPEYDEVPIPEREYQLENLKSTDNFHNFLKFSNIYSAISVTRVGAIDSYITNEEMKRLI